MCFVKKKKVIDYDYLIPKKIIYSQTLKKRFIIIIFFTYLNEK